MTYLDEIRRLRDGGSYGGDMRPFVEPSPAAIEELAAELRQNPSETIRTEIVKILVNVGIETDPFQSIHNRRILSALLMDATIVPDKACALAMEKIAGFAAPRVLSEFRPTIAALLERFAEAPLLLVAARAKAYEASPSLQKLSTDPAWSGSTELRIALAALGDEAEEEAFTKPFQTTLDPKQKMELATTLAKIGTRTSLKALAEDMRSPLVLVVPNSFEVSVRTEIAQALRSMHPECAFLSSIESDADYERIERFCESEYAVEWKRPRPPFLTMRTL